MTVSCFACDLTAGAILLPGGLIFSTSHWRVEHCIGPLPVGTVVAKPIRHVVHLSQLEDNEAAEMGPLLRNLAGIVGRLTDASQVYTCMWSAGPKHIHFVIQPETPALVSKYNARGPKLQSELFARGAMPDESDIERFTARARQAAAQTQWVTCPSAAS